MPSQREMLRVLADLEDIRSQARKLSEEQPDGWREQYTAFRGRAATQFMLVGEVGEAWLATQGDTPLTQDYRALMDNMRASMAWFHDRWPNTQTAVDDPAYWDALKRIDALRTDLLGFASFRMTG